MVFLVAQGHIWPYVVSQYYQVLLVLHSHCVHTVCTSAHTHAHHLNAESEPHISIKYAVRVFCFCFSSHLILHAACMLYLWILHIFPSIAFECMSSSYLNSLSSSIKMCECVVCTLAKDSAINLRNNIIHFWKFSSRPEFRVVGNG